MKQCIGILSLLMVASCTNRSTVEHSAYKTMMIKSMGEIETLPDLATFQVYLRCVNKSITASKKCLIDKSNELTTKLLSLGIEEDDILTTAVDMNKSYSWSNNSRVFDGYRTSTTMYITVRDLDELDELYTGLLDNENLDLNGLRYYHTKIDSLENEAYLNALEKSGKLTDTLLDRLPETKKEILHIGNIRISSSVPQRNESGIQAELEMPDMMSAKNNSIAVNKGTIKVTATLYVEYKIW